MALVNKNFLQTTLTATISAAATHAPVSAAAYTEWLAGMGAGDFFYAVMVDATNERELVQVNFTGSTPALGLAIDRGKEGTTPRPWASGTNFWQDITADQLGDLNQKAAFRSGAFIPDGTLTQNFFGEKFYQTDLQLYWKSVGASEWRLIVGEIFTADVIFSPTPGSYTPGTLLTMTCATPGAAIYYTTDGSDPDQTDTLYTGPVTIPNPGPTTFKAKAFGAERYQSPSQNITSGVYTIVTYTSWSVVQVPLAPPSFLGGGLVWYNAGIGNNIVHGLDRDLWSYEVDGTWGIPVPNIGAPINVIRDIAVIGASLYAASDFGQLYVLTGNVWTQIQGNYTNTTNIWRLFVDGATLYSLHTRTAAPGGMFRWTGATWVSDGATPTYQMSLNNVVKTTAGDIFAGTLSASSAVYRGALWKKVGASFTQVASQINGNSRVAIANNGNTIYGFGDQGASGIMQWNGVNAWNLVATNGGYTGNVIAALMWNGKLYGISLTGELWEWDLVSPTFTLAAPTIGETITFMGIFQAPGRSQNELYALNPGNAHLIRWT